MRTGVVVVIASVLLALAGCSSDGVDTPSAGSGGAAAIGGANGGSGGVSGVAGSVSGGTGGAAGANASTGGTAGTVAGSGGAGGTAGAMAGTAGAGAAADAGDDPDAQVPDGTGPFPPVSDFEAAGPYTSTTMSNVGPNSNYTIYHPSELAPDGARNPIVAWTSGGATDHTWYTLLPHLASHGFVVISSNTVPGIGAEIALGEEMVAGIDWLIAETARAGSAFEGKLDTTKIAATGYSMGSLATFTIAMDERLTTTVHISGGNMAPERINNLRKPAAFICGIPGDANCGLIDTTCDIAGANCALDFEGATTPVFYATFENGHLGVMTPPFQERIAGMTTEWLRMHLMSDPTREASFIGEACGYCGNADWEVKQKNLE